MTILNNNKLYIIAMFLICFCHANAQEQNDSFPDIDIILSKEMMDNRYKGITFLENMCITNNRFILLADKDSLYILGYGGIASYGTIEKNITAFCTSKGTIYYSKQNYIVQIDSLGENTVATLPFVPLKIWNGVDAIYAIGEYNGEFVLFAIFLQYNKLIKLISLQDELLNVFERGKYIYAITTKEILIINGDKYEYITEPLPSDVLSDINSVTIDFDKNAIYISCNTGIYKYHQHNLQKIYDNNGILCFDKDGLVLFNAHDCTIFRFRNKILYPEQHEVIIETR